MKDLYRYGFTKEFLKKIKCLQIEHSSEAPIIVVFKPHERALLLVRKAKSKKLGTDIKLNFNDLKLFILLFHGVLTNSGMKIIPLVVTNKKLDQDHHDCDLCMNDVLSEEEFTEIDKFNVWWVWREIYFETEYKGEINETLSKNILAKLTGILASVLVYPNHIPKFTDWQNSHQHMEHLTVLLTPAQMDVYYSQDKHMMIKSGFGCGKSIIAAAILQKI